MKIGYGVEPTGINHLILSAVSAIETADNPNDISFLIVIDPREKYDLKAIKEKVLKAIDKNKVTFADPHPYFTKPPSKDDKITKSTRAGIIHGLHLDQLIEKSDDEDLLICDADTCFLMKGWDSYILSKYSSISCPIVGSSMPDGHQQNWEKFPYIDFCLVNTGVLKGLGIKMCKKFFPNEREDLAARGLTIPYDGDRWYDVTDDDSWIWGKPAGSRVFTETGWKMCYAFKTLKVGYVALPCVSRNHLGPRSYWYKDAEGKEYVVCHMGNSRKRPWGSPYHAAWIDDVMKYWDSMNFDASKIVEKVNSALLLGI